MSEIQSVVNALLARAAKVDPVMMSVIQEIVNELARLGFEIDPAPIVSTKVSSETRPAPLPVSDFSYSLNENNVILSWSAPSPSFVYYEIRKGNTWNTATRVTITSNREVLLDPLTIGTHRYLIRTLSTQGVYSVEEDFIDVVIPVLGPVSVSAEQLETNVLLRWTIPTSTFRIDYYTVTRNGVQIGIVKGTFFPIFETTGGTFEYGITAVDIAGNESSETTVEVTLPNPANFLFQDSFVSGFGGTKTNAISTGTSLLVAIDLTTTYEDHFIDNGWASPQEQVDDGYPKWLSPFLTTASYKETFDAGTIYSNTIITLAWATNLIAGAFTIGTSTRVSDDGISWSSAVTDSTFFVTSVRYIEVTINFTGADDKSLLEFYNFQVAISVREELDSGEISALAADAAGTVVTFNKEFKQVNSITVAADTTTDRIAVYEFAGGINPTTFKIRVFDSVGVRQDATVSWKARGIV